MAVLRIGCACRRKQAVRILAACLLAGGFAALVILLMPQPAAAFEIFGIHLWGKKKSKAEDLIEDPKYYTITVPPFIPQTQKAEKPAADKTRLCEGGRRAANKGDKQVLVQAAAGAKLAESNSLLWAGRKKPVAGSGALLARARSDYARILAAFYADGRYGPVLSVKINGREAADIPYGTELPEHNSIVIRVDGGAQYHFDSAKIINGARVGGWRAPDKSHARVGGRRAPDKSHARVGGWRAPDKSYARLAQAGPVGSGRRDVRQARGKNSSLPAAVAGNTVAAKLAAEQEKLGFIQGAAAQSGVVFAAEEQAVNNWRQQGYAKAKIAERKIIADHAGRTVNAVIEVNPGRQARFGPLVIHNVSGKPHMDSHYIAWLTGLKEGEVYSPAALAKADARLGKLEVFRSAGLSEADTIQSNGLLPLSLTLQERPLHRFGGGGSYSTIDGLGLSTYWMHRNLFGHAERLRLDAGVSNIAGDRNKSSADPKDYSYMVGGTFVCPGIFTPDTDYVASLKAEREVLDNYTSKGIYFSNGFNRNFSDRLSGTIYAEAAQIQVKDDVWGKRDFTTMGLLGGLLYDSRDNKNDATKGYYGQLAAQPFYEAKYGNFIGKMTAEARTYFAFDKRSRLVFALRGKIGTIGGAPIAELPSNMLFFIGGGGSVRGYAYRSIGIYKKGDKIIGGRSMLEGSAELRAMIGGNIGLVGFVDAGVVGKNPSPNFDQNTKLGAGLGVRYKTGMGPLRVDVALPLNREKGDSRYGLYIGIGQAF